MDKKVNNKKTFRCNNCGKTYSSKSSLCNHVKKFHNTVVTESNGLNINNQNLGTENTIVNNTKIIESNNNNKLKCKYCNKLFKHKQNKYEHQKNVCEPKDIKNKELLKLKDEANQKKEELELQLKLKEKEESILKLKLKLEKSNKIDNVTLNQLNKKLRERNNLIKNSTVNSHNTNIQNNIVNNFQLVGFGKEEVFETLTNREKKMIMNANYGSLEKLIEIVHCGRYNQFKNIILTNLKDNYIYKYDANKGVFVLSTKVEVLNALIDFRICDLEIIYTDLLERNKLDEKTKTIIEKFINKVNESDDRYIDYMGTPHQNYKEYKISEIKILLFNNKDKISNDISLLLSTDETYKTINDDFVNEIININQNKEHETNDDHKIELII
jgi:uncharacterized C2H2 Zn-finger protein